jgi:transketolase
MQQKVIYIMSHDSIGLGEDGPTHQPIEHLVSLRAIPELAVMRPGTAIEVLLCWYTALQRKGPSILCLSRQSLYRKDLQEQEFKNPQENWSQALKDFQKGAYIFRCLRDHELQPLQVIFWSSGTELGLACRVQNILWETYKIPSQVISVPYWLPWVKQSIAYKKSLHGSSSSLHVVIEASNLMGWERFVENNHTIYCGIDTFGLSAPYEKIYDYFGLTPEHIMKRIQEYMENN